MKRFSSQYSNSKILVWTKAHKKIAVGILLFIVTAGVVVGYVIYSVAAWKNMSEQADNTKKELHEQSEKLLQQSKVRVDDLRSFETRLKEENANTCRDIRLLQWQTNVSSSAKSIEAECQKTRTQISTLASSLRAIIVRAEEENDITKVLMETNTQLQTVKSSDFKVLAATWRAAREKIIKIHTDQSLKTVKSRAIEVIRGIEAALDKLEKADQKKDRAAFDVALADVEKSYSKLSSIQNISVDSFAELIDKLTDATKKLDE